MKEYTILALISVIAVFPLGKILKTEVLKKGFFYIFLLVILFFKFLVNGYLTGNRIVLYNDDFFMGVRLGSIPLEDFLFGFSMVSLTIIFWEYFLNREKDK
jgi:lycopene cyclase domain-containing protein